jgi:pilus assembly protein CpaB
MSPERMNRWLLIGAAAFALMAGALVFALLANVGSGDGGGGGRTSATGDVNVLVAKETIALGTFVTEDMFETATFDARYIVPDAVDDAKSLIGRTAKSEILAGQQISARQFVSGTENDEFSDQIAVNVPPGHRAYSMSISEETAVGGLLVPGDRVDIIVRYSTKQAPDAPNKQVHIELFAGNVLVLARGQTKVEDAPPIGSGDAAAVEGETTDTATAGRPDDVDPDPGAATLTLALTPEQVLAINQYEVLEDGEISIALRRFGEDAPFPAEGLIINVLEQ